MKTTKLLAGALVAIGGLAMTSIVSATAPVTVESNGDLTVCGIEYVSDENGAYGCITIQGKNVGATTTGTGRNAQDTSFGNYYNRGVNTPYLPGQAAIFNPDNNAWGGGGDYDGDFFYQVYPVLNPIDRKGPCDTGYHVPSEGEWNALMDMYVGSEDGVHGGLYEYYYSFVNDFQIPYAGYYYNDGEYLNDTSALWFSSPSYDDSAQAFRFYYSESYGQVTQFDHDSALPVRCFKNPSVSSPSVSYVELTNPNTQVTVGQTEYNELPNTMTVTINNVQQVNNKLVLGEVSVSFGSNESAKFSKLVKINVPVENAEQVIIKVKHAGSSEYNFDGLTTNVNASCNNGRPTSSQYNGEAVTVVDGYASIYTCEASSFIAVGEGPISAHINLSVLKGALTIGTETGNLNLGQVNVSNNAQELSGSFGANSFWVEDMKGVESGYYTTISVTDLTGSVSGHVISADNVSLKTENTTPSNVSGATANDAKVIFGEGITSWHSGSGQVNYFQRLNTSTADAGRVGKWGDNLQIKVNIPAHTPYDTYRGTITYTLYDMDS